MPSVCIVLVNWNNPARTIKSLRSIKATDYPDYQILLIDNGSDDNSVELISQAEPEITVLRNQRNLGFARGVNIGIRLALTRQVDHIWILNNDLEVSQNALTDMVALIESDHTIGAVGSMLVENDGGHSETIWGGGQVNFITGLPEHLHQARSQEKTLGYLKGASLLFRAEALDQIGLFDERYFLYWEDTDICFRLRAAGWKLRVANKALVYHEGYGSMTFRSPEWDYHFTRSSIIFFKQHARFSPLPIVVSVTGRLFRRFFSGKWQNIRAVFAATGILRGSFKPELVKPINIKRRTQINRKNLILLDPCSFTPFYDINLGTALVGSNWQVEWVTSEFPFAGITSPDTLITNKLFFSRFPASSLLKIERINQINFLRGGIKTLVYPLEMMRLHTRLKQVTPGIMHIQWANLPWIDAHFWKKWQASGWKLVYTLHDVMPLPGTTPQIFSGSRQKLPHLADRVLVHSENSRRQLIAQGLNEDKIRKIPLGPTLTKPSQAIDQAEARSQLALTSEARVILFFGFIKPYKGLNVLLRSLPAISHSLENIHLIVAGKLLEPFSRYQRIVNELSIAARLHWFLDFATEEMLAVYFSAADIVVTPYLQGSSSSIIDLAHKFNKPVVATAVGGLEEQVSKLAGDRLVPPNNSELLARAIIEGIKEIESSVITTDNPRKFTGDNKAEWKAIAALHSDIYKQLLTIEREIK